MCGLEFPMVGRLTSRARPELPIWFPNQKSITVVAAAGTNQAGKDGHYKLIEGRAEETIRLIDSIDTGGEDDDAHKLLTVNWGYWRIFDILSTIWFSGCAGIFLLF